MLSLSDEFSVSIETISSSLSAATRAVWKVGCKSIRLPTGVKKLPNR